MVGTVFSNPTLVVLVDALVDEFGKQFSIAIGWHKGEQQICYTFVDTSPGLNCSHVEELAGVSQTD